MKYIKYYFLALLSFGLADTAVAQSNKHLAVVANQTVSQYLVLDKFNWNDSATIPSVKQIAALEKLLLQTQSQHPNDSDLSDSIALAKINYQLGTYYTHIAREPDIAIRKLTAAQKFLNDPEEKAWIFDHLAYAYELKFADGRQNDDKQNALYYVNAVISKNAEKTSKVAFAYCVKGLVFNDAYDYIKAEASFNKALSIYEALNLENSEQYFRAKNRLASIILDQHDREQEVIAMLKPLRAYWLHKHHLQTNPYAARTFITLGEAYLKIGKGKPALQEFNQALVIYKNIYGMNAKNLAKPYNLIAQAYQVMGDQHHADIYAKKSATLKK